MLTPATVRSTSKPRNIARETPRSNKIVVSPRALLHPPPNSSASVLACMRSCTLSPPHLTSWSETPPQILAIVKTSWTGRRFSSYGGVGWHRRQLPPCPHRRRGHRVRSLRFPLVLYWMLRRIRTRRHVLLPPRGIKNSRATPKPVPPCCCKYRVPLGVHEKDHHPQLRQSSHEGSSPLPPSFRSLLCPLLTLLSTDFTTALGFVLRAPHPPWVASLPVCAPASVDDTTMEWRMMASTPPTT